MTPADRSRAALVAALASLALLLSGCWSGSAEPDAGATPSSPVPSSPPGPPGPRAYAALGDSYAAAPFVPTTDLAGGCLRSSGNYPALVDRALAPRRFDDVSCSGAESRDLLRPQPVVGGQGRVPAQLEVVGPDTDLVTVGIGGNDGDLFSSLVCAFTGQQLAQCQVSSPADVEDVLDRTRRDAAAALRRVVSQAAPEALVLLVGYPRLVDPDRSCPALPIRGAQLAQVARAEQGLRTTLRAAAGLADVEFLDMWGPSRGHEVCSDDPWVNGERTDQSRALAYHPFAEEQEAVARLVERRWRDHAS